MTQFDWIIGTVAALGFICAVVSLLTKLSKSNYSRRWAGRFRVIADLETGQFRVEGLFPGYDGDAFWSTVDDEKHSSFDAAAAHADKLCMDYFGRRRRAHRIVAE